MPQQPGPSFTPAFTAAFKDVTKLANTTEERLFAEFKDLSPKQRFTKLKQKWGLYQLIPAPLVITPATTLAVQKMTTFLTALNETIQDPTIGQPLTTLPGLGDDNARLGALKQLFLKDNVVEACANYLNMAIKSQYRNKTDEVNSMADAYTHKANELFTQIASQGNYDPEKKAVSDLIRLLESLLDFILIQSGFEAVFSPTNEETDKGRWDDKQKLFLGKKPHA